MEKPFKGVIKSWEFNRRDYPNRVRGTVVACNNSNQTGASKGDVIITSEVERIYVDKEGCVMCETKNSLYMLMEGK